MNILSLLVEDQAKDGDVYLDAQDRCYRVYRGASTGALYLQCDDGLMLPERFLRIIEIAGFRPKSSLTRLAVARHHITNLKALKTQDPLKLITPKDEE